MLCSLKSGAGATSSPECSARRRDKAMKRALFLLPLFLLALTPVLAASAHDERIAGSWIWRHEVVEEKTGQATESEIRLTFGRNGEILLKPHFYDHAPDVFYGTYEADGGILRFTVTRVALFFKNDGESVYFSRGEKVSTAYSLRDGRLVMKLLGDVRAFTRVTGQ